MGKDCGRGNEQLSVKAHTVCYVAKGEVGGPKSLLTYRLANLFRNAPNLGKKDNLSRET